VAFDGTKDITLTPENLGFGEEAFLYIGGTSSAPLEVKMGNSLVFDNPYSGKRVTFIPQLKVTSASDSISRWVDVTWYQESNYGRGVNVTVTSDGKIGIYCGHSSLLQVSELASGIPKGLLPSGNVTSAPFRLRVI
uniref:hypothetical protein n=1 Tax=Pectobacterium sp. B1J-3 TaxID=3385371 RepID=UPI0039069147